MNQTEKLLKSIVENARMGISACEQLLKKSDDFEISKELMLEKQHYSELARDAEQQLFDMNLKPEPEGLMQRMGMWMGMQMDTMTDDSASHIADIAIQGLTMGVIGMTRDQGNLPEASAEAQGMATAFIQSQQSAIDRLKTLLPTVESRV
mgnify:CR=1 FL=1